MSDRPSSWRGVYVEFDPQGGFMLLWDGVGFLGTVQSKEALWEGIKRARKGSPPCTSVFDPKPKVHMTDAERWAMVSDYLSKHPNVRVPVRSDMKDTRIPTDAEIDASVLRKKVEKMGDKEREELLRQLMAMEKEDEAVQDIQPEHGQDGGGPDDAGPGLEPGP